jgi:hypothetical protein
MCAARPIDASIAGCRAASEFARVKVRPRGIDQPQVPDRGARAKQLVIGILRVRPDPAPTPRAAVQSPSVPVLGHPVEVREEGSLLVVEVRGEQRRESLEVAAQSVDALGVVATQVPCCRADLEDEH